MFENNNVDLGGRVGCDISLNQSAAGFWCMASICTNVPLRNSDGGYYIKDIWHNVLFFGSLAVDFSKFVKKGDFCKIKAYIDYNTKSSENGLKTKFTNIIAYDFEKNSGKDYQSAISEIVENIDSPEISARKFK
jgi:single-stranded DNA-binding protein